jgi:8-oxo-dGTP pyrophosphatase MutT (NUDIX family)
VFDRLKLALAQHEKSNVVANTEILAAVLIPVFLKNDEYHLLFTKRTDLVKTHKGEICFPGGHYEPEDITMLATALRETNEEVGIPTRDIQVAGELDSTINASSGYIITSYVGFIPYPHTLKLEEREIVEALEVPISFLLDPANLREEMWNRNGREFLVQFYNYQERIIWGATGRILKIFLPIWALAASSGER